MKIIKRKRGVIHYCKCGCGGVVSFYRGKPRDFIQYHHIQTESNKKIHAERMQGNLLFKGKKHTKEARQKISISQTGKNNSMWCGGIGIASGGYRMVYMPEHPFSDINGKVHEERMVMEKVLGRFLLPYETVHHINHIKTDNEICNLQVMSRKEHRQLHNRLMWETRSHLLSEKIKKRMSDSHKGIKPSDETKLKMKHSAKLIWEKRRSSC